MLAGGPMSLSIKPKLHMNGFKTMWDGLIMHLVEQIRT